MLGKKTAVITGASGGIGAGLVEAFLKEGYHVVGTSRNAEGGAIVEVDGYLRVAKSVAIT